MERSKLGIRIGLAVVSLLVVAGGAWAVDKQEPDESSAYRGLRSDYVKQWYIYTDTVNDGILDPGDTKVATMKNWWTTESSGTQHNMCDGPYGGYVYGNDTASGPMNYAVTDPTDPDASKKNVWLPTKENSVSVYMTYSQRDNNDDRWGTGTYADYMRERHADSGGYALGWTTNAIKRDPHTGAIIDDTTPAGTNMLDILVHNGKFDGTIAGFGASKSNPHVTQSNDMSKLAKDPNAGVAEASRLYVPPKYDDTNHEYNPASNVNMQAWWNATSGGTVTLTDADIATIAGSMEVREVNPYDAGASWNAIVAGKTPEEIRNSAAIKAMLAAGGTLDPAMLEYLYDDAYTNRGYYVENANDGGVIGGLAGLDDYDPEANNWADQQVIRIDVSSLMLDTVDEIVFYDFGDSVKGGIGVGQIDPTAIVFGVVEHGGEKRLWFDLDGDDVFDVSELLPDNIIYIAQVEVTPEPATLVLLALGGVGIIVQRRRNRKSRG